MQYELRTQVVDQRRSTFSYLAPRLGGKPATRYEEGSVGIQPKENFHYRPLWAPAHELYGADWSACGWPTRTRSGTHGSTTTRHT